MAQLMEYVHNRADSESPEDGSEDLDLTAYPDHGKVIAFCAEDPTSEESIFRTAPDYAVGAILFRVGAGDPNQTLYINTGTNAAAVWTASTMVPDEG